MFIVTEYAALTSLVLYVNFKNQVSRKWASIIELFGLCKGSNFNIYIWVWFGILSTNEGKSALINNLVKYLMNTLFRPRKRAEFHENHGRIYTELTFIYPWSANHSKSSAFVVYRHVFEASLTDSVDPDQTAHASSLIWVHTVYLFIYIHQ